MIFFRVVEGGIVLGNSSPDTSMDEHLAAWQIAEFIVGGLDED